MKQDEIIELAFQTFGGIIKKEERNNFLAFAKLVAEKAIKEALAQPEQYPQIAINPEIVGYVAPQSTWVRLTDEEIYKIHTKEGWNGLIFAHAIESKLKAKNTREQE